MFRYPLSGSRLALISLTGTAALSALAVPLSAAAAPARYSPGIALAGETLKADGTPRTYQTPKGVAFWTPEQPISQGDKLKLNLMVATGPNELGEVKVRLDNAKIADVTAAPWSTTLETANLALGYHMVEVWAQTAGDKPQTASKTLSFYVAKPETQVKGSQQQLVNGQETTVTPGDAPDPSTPPALPAFLAGRPADTAAQVALVYGPASDRVTLTPPEGVVPITQPTFFTLKPVPGSTAQHYAYVLVRDGANINGAVQPLNLQGQSGKTDIIKIQKRTEQTPGLRPGPLTLWVWGIDQDGRPSLPLKAQLDVQE